MSSPSIRACAPGKLFLMGEYVVLRGAPAIVTAVNRRVIAEVTPSGDHNWRLTSTELDLHAQVIRPGGNDRDNRVSVVEALLGELEAASLLSAPRHLHIDSSGLYTEDGKLGIGSSAAVTVALLTALLQDTGETLDAAARFELAQRAHSKAQGNIGSGGDIAASVYGGTLQFEQGRPAASLEALSDLEIICVRAGRPASTSQFVARYEACRREKPQQIKDLEQVMTALAIQTTAAWADGNAADVIRLAGEFGLAMAQLGEACKLPIAGEAFEMLDQAAGKLGGSYKPSGAGGGDVGLFFLPAGIRQSKLDQVLNMAGITALPLKMHAPAAGHTDSNRAA